MSAATLSSMASSTASGATVLRTWPRASESIRPFAVKIGWEIAGVGEHDLAIWTHRQRCSERLVHFDRQRVAHHHCSGLRTDQRHDLVADAARLVHPAGEIPGANQHLAPFALNRL